MTTIRRPRALLALALGLSLAAGAAFAGPREDARAQNAVRKPSLRAAARSLLCAAHIMTW